VDRYGPLKYCGLLTDFMPGILATEYPEAA
jgi:hypothetical protein